MDKFLVDFGVFGLLDFVARAEVAGGEIDSETLQSRSETEGKIASDAARADGFFAVSDDAV